MQPNIQRTEEEGEWAKLASGSKQAKQANNQSIEHSTSTLDAYFWVHDRALEAARTGGRYSLTCRRKNLTEELQSISVHDISQDQQNASFSLKWSRKFYLDWNRIFKQLNCTLLALNIGPAPKLCSRPRAWLMRPSPFGICICCHGGSKLAEIAIVTKNELSLHFEHI